MTFILLTLGALSIGLLIWLYHSETVNRQLRKTNEQQAAVIEWCDKREPYFIDLLTSLRGFMIASNPDRLGDLKSTTLNGIPSKQTIGMLDIYVNGFATARTIAMEATRALSRWESENPVPREDEPAHVTPSYQAPPQNTAAEPRPSTVNGPLSTTDLKALPLYRPYK